MAGYFRVRIPSISVFDKILGGLTWCITCSNNDVDIEYNDDMTMVHKNFKLGLKSEIIRKSGCSS